MRAPAWLRPRALVGAVLALLVAGLVAVPAFVHFRFGSDIEATTTTAPAAAPYEGEPDAPPRPG